ncbi:hypothetical protein DNHGIG_25930 [Collibacillus ludicampi]|uniref:Gp5/Type VI secretion system Vgr protein OB-fold domain-containing protein n=1 Tax=Collibacillus ludicampi TaxID=2771369 RepID=A0AAV4LH74_9BACL|nr:phage baseplate assembly protein V [Collibacillus ludicampi]GIM47044.1 hypothetical protein DNHGIG_25930 [Collibacillus ludicampi]
MYSPSTNWIEQVKFVAREMINNKMFVLEGIVTSVDPNPPYKVKVMLEPYGIESGWLKVATPYVGNGFGFVFPPPAEGTPVKVIFDLGDIKNGVVIGSVFNDNVKMPSVPYGAAGLVHQSGSSIIFNPDGSVVLSGANGGSLTIDKTGAVSISGKNSSQSW